MIKAVLKRVEIWGWIYLIFIVISAAIVFGLFNSSTHSGDQIAFVIALPIVIGYATIKFSAILRLFQNEDVKSNSKSTQEKQLPQFLLISLLFLLLALITLFFALTMFISTLFYFAVDLGWAGNAALHMLVYPSIYICLASILIFLVLLFIHSINIQWQQVKEQLLQFWDELCQSFDLENLAHNKSVH
jgi:NADH:ubiquinone oxidoreductase subunit 5 (subunit L)/multisubunit Na+/H+ antiporter MnhA subunit